MRAVRAERGLLATPVSSFAAVRTRAIAGDTGAHGDRNGYTFRPCISYPDLSEGCVAEQLPRFDKGERDEQRPRATHADDPAVLYALREGKPWERQCATGEEAMLLATRMIDRDDGVPERIVFQDGTDIGSLAIRQEYERRKAIGTL